MFKCIILKSILPLVKSVSIEVVVFNKVKMVCMYLSAEISLSILAIKQSDSLEKKDFNCSLTVHVATTGNYKLHISC